MTYQEALGYLDSFVNYEKRACYNYRNSVKLERMQRLAERLGSPHLGIKSIHIAGTKGKGSTAAMVQSILTAHGYRAGLYTSPHLVTVRERIRIGDALIGEDDTARLVGKLREIADGFSGERPTFFELYTALAFMYFKERDVDFAVYEVGMGGRFDATNIVTPLAVAITPVSYDHTECLGLDLRSIASEKAGIIKRYSVCVLGPQEDEALGAIESIAASKDAALYKVGSDIIFEDAVSCDETKEVFNVFGLFGEYPLCEISLLGEHQIANAATAIGIIEALRFSGITITQGSIREGLKCVKWPGRVEVMRRDPLVILDGAHNGASAKALARTLRRNFRFKRLLLILGISKNKDIKGIIEPLEPITDKVILTKSNIPERVEEPAAIAGFLRRTGKVTVTENLKSAIDEAFSLANADDCVLITGSIFLVGEAKAVLNEYKF